MFMFMLSKSFAHQIKFKTETDSGPDPRRDTDAETWDWLNPQFDTSSYIIPLLGIDDSFHF